MPSRAADLVRRGPEAPVPRRAVVRRVVTRVVVPAVLAVLVLLPDLLGLDRHLPFAVFSALRPALTVVAAAGLVLVAVVLRRRLRATGVVGLAAVAVVVAVAAAIVVPRAIPAPPPPPGGTPLTVLELNAFEGNADAGALAAVVRRERPDLVVLPEAGERFRARMAALLPEYRSWTNVPARAADVRGITVLSSPRAGDVTARTISDAPGTPTDTRYPWAEITGGILGPVRLGAVHVVSIVPGWVSYWPGELAQMQRWCSGGPALVVGDFNATPDHSAFRAGTAGCTDAATERGASLTGTWFAGVPRAVGAQIDHVLMTGGPQARDVSVIDVPGTDHRALLAHLRLM
ncbi:endonuclease/exonuclease/phosphatase (EEP) superfamily protein YafD [Actinomycetospora succinea]|uniref:Endonuclease/exonuclease/phosphatase (EEP) superfamily protein YafD n=1 Tax=Actinomycetospora succinea TaxID=663603 RepID=A0A4R6UPL3_9PSEU|nr:endonuclease/exonuclease/phosphatase family protein [Actinomycetospora succinea]TDQ48941.1 endonuclease/exonuclease/phosphatase (EEP) superfamily protein YafD [Actinomycetospora succinea]